MGNNNGVFEQVIGAVNAINEEMQGKGTEEQNAELKRAVKDMNVNVTELNNVLSQLKDIQSKL